MSDIFLKLLNVSITAGYIIIAVLLIRLLIKKAPKWINCILWALVGVRLIFPFSVKSVLSLIPSAEVINIDTVIFSKSPSVSSGINAVDNMVNPVLGTVFKSDAANSVNPLQILTEVAGIVWICGLTAMLIYALVSAFRIKKQLREAVRTDGGIYYCDNIKTPFIFGVFRPRIYLPANTDGENAGYIISHEKAHLKRGDYIWKPLGFMILAVYWFNPLVWLGYIFLCRDIEYACDEKVIKTLDRNGIADYSEALLKFSSPARMIKACPVAFGEVGVKGRIKSALNYKKPTFWIIIAALIVCIAAALCLLTDPKENNIRILKPEREYTDIEEMEKESRENLKKYGDDEKMIESIKKESRRLIADENKVCGYVNGEPITGKEFNIRLLHDAVSRMGEKITDEEIICEIAKQRLIIEEAKRLGKTFDEEQLATAKERAKNEYPDSVFKAAGISEETYISLAEYLEKDRQYRPYYITTLTQGLTNGDITTESERVNKVLKEAEDIQFRIKVRSSNENTEEIKELFSEYTEKMRLAFDEYTNDLVDNAEISIVVK